MTKKAKTPEDYRRKVEYHVRQAKQAAELARRLAERAKQVFGVELPTPQSLNPGVSEESQP